jgi:ribosomal protein L2
VDSLDDQECSHVIQTKQEYETLLDQRNRATREKEETERAAAREISRVKQEAAHEADRAAQRAQAQIDDLLQQVERKTAEIADQRALNANLLRISRERANADRGLRPKKIHTGYVVVMSSEKEIRYVPFGKRLKSPTSAPSTRTFSEFRGKEQMRIEGCDRKRYIPGMLS